MDKRNNSGTSEKPNLKPDFFNVPRYLFNSSQLQTYYQLLCCFEFLLDKIQHPEFGVQALIKDYDLLNTPEATTHSSCAPETVKALRLIQHALQLCDNRLAEEPTQLVAYLWDKLQSSSELPEINNLLQEAFQVAKQRQIIWFRSSESSLPLPGKRLRHTLSGHGSLVNVVAVSSDGKQAVSGSEDGTLKVWDLKTGEASFPLKGHEKSVTAIAITPDNEQVISASEDGTLKVWKFNKQSDLDKKKEIFTLQALSTLTKEEKYAITTLAITSTSKGKWVTIVVRRKRKTWQYWLGLSLMGLINLVGLANWWRFWGWLTWSFLGYMLWESRNWLWLGLWGLIVLGGLLELLDLKERLLRLLGLWERLSRFLDLWVKSHRVIMWDLAKEEEVLSEGFDADTITLTPDGNKAILWSTESHVHSGFSYSTSGAYVVFKIKNLLNNASPNEKQVIYRVEGKDIVVYNLKTRARFTLIGHNEEVTAVAITPDGKQAISGSKDKSLKIWSLETKQELLTLNGHTDWVSSVTISPDGKQAISSSKDGTLKIWNLENLEGS